MDSPRRHSDAPAESDAAGNPLVAAARNSDNALVQRLGKPIERATDAVETVTRSRPVRSFLRYNEADGNLLSSGMSFQAVFAVFAALYVGFAVAGLWLLKNPELFETLIGIINNAIPNLIGDDGLVTTDQIQKLTSVNIFGWTGAIALFGLLFTAIGWLASTRQAIRAIFHLPKVEANFLLQKAIDLALALSFGVLLVLAAVASMLSTQTVSWMLEILGIPSSSFWGNFVAGAVGLLASVALNLVTLSALYRILARIPIPRRELLLGALLGAVALSLLSVASGAVLGGATRNPLFATFAVFIGLLIWFNFVCRVILIAAAWIAEGLAQKGVVLIEKSEEERLADLHRARVLLARTEVEESIAQLRAARGLAKIPARIRLDKARSKLSEERSKDPGKNAAGRPRPTETGA